MPQAPIAIAADYADAMMTARRAKHWLFLLLLIVLMAQLAVFFVAKFTHLIIPDGSAATQPARTLECLHYLIALTDFLGIALVLVLAMVLLLIVKIMLVGRLIGVSRVTSAYIWCIILAVMLFPWQSFMQNPVVHSIPGQMAVDFKIPGVLYTWAELIHPTLGAKFDSSWDNRYVAILRWARFVAFPVIALIILLMIQAKSTRGLKLALGETAEDDDSAAPMA